MCYLNIILIHIYLISSRIEHFLLMFLFIILATLWGMCYPWPGIQPEPRVVEVQSLNHWTTWEVSLIFFSPFLYF